jgi:hypothetical protein
VTPGEGPGIRPTATRTLERAVSRLSPTALGTPTASWTRRTKQILEMNRGSSLPRSDSAWSSSRRRANSNASSGGCFCSAGVATGGSTGSTAWGLSPGIGPTRSRRRHGTSRSAARGDGAPQTVAAILRTPRWGRPRTFTFSEMPISGTRRPLRRRWRGPSGPATNCPSPDSRGSFMGPRGVGSHASGAYSLGARGWN